MIATKFRKHVYSKIQDQKYVYIIAVHSGVIEEGNQSQQTS